MQRQSSQIWIRKVEHLGVLKQWIGCGSGEIEQYPQYAQPDQALQIIKEEAVI
jgi:hypothetical protein